MVDQDLEDSLRIARRELALALERHDDDSAAILERAIDDLEHGAGRDGAGRDVVRLPDVAGTPATASDVPRQRTADRVTSESDEVD